MDDATLDIPWSDPAAKVVSKGKKINVKVTLDKIRRCVETIARHHHLEIHSGQLSESLRKKYTRLKYISSILSQSKHSVAIESVIREAFAGIPRDQIRPGTLGAWCVGCLIDGDARSTLCCNAMKIGEGVDPWTECRGNVVLAEWNGDSYQFKMIKRSARYARIAFIELQHDTFLGFSTAETKWLSSHGLAEGYINGRRGGEFIELQRFSSLDSLKRRSGGGRLLGGKVSTSDGTWMVWLLVFIVILFLIGGYFMRR